MKKLGVILLASVLLFGLAAQAGAMVSEVGVDAFAGDQVIDFDKFAADYECSLGKFPVVIGDQYKPEFGVSFSGLLYGEKNWAPIFFTELAAGNFNICEFYDSLTTPGEPITVSFDKPVTRVGFFGLSPNGAITVTPFRNGFATAAPVSVNTPWSVLTFIGIDDPEGIDAIIIEGTGALTKENIFWIDDLTFGGTVDTGPTEIEVTMNVNPPSCSGASINMKSKGVTPVVIAGSEDFDVTMIDPASIQLHGVAPVRSAIEDVPYCNNSGSDGYSDLTLKFDTKDLVDAMEASALAEGLTLENDDLPVLHLTGSLLDGTIIYADEPVSVKGKPWKENRGRGVMHPLRHNRGHHKGWDNNRGHHKGWDKHR
jgi:hypothetical protein